MDEVEAVVVGAGVIGLAAARALALAGHEVVVLERAYTIGFETSSRNSEVIHGGLYYPAGSLKARSCVEGRERLYAYCREHGVPHSQLGKLIVATSEAQHERLAAIAAQAAANGCAEAAIWTRTVSTGTATASATSRNRVAAETQHCRTRQPAERYGKHHATTRERGPQRSLVRSPND